MNIGASLQGIFRRSIRSVNNKEKSASNNVVNVDCSSEQNQIGLSERLMLQYRDTASDQALSSLFDLHSTKLYYFLMVMSDKQTAEDIAQRTWILVIEKRASFTHANNFQAWLFTIGRRALIDEFRRTSKMTYDSEAIDNTATCDNSSQQRDYDEEDLGRLLCQLPYKQKEALSLQLEGFSLMQISEICRVPQETVKTRLRYARDNLKSLVERA